MFISWYTDVSTLYRCVIFILVCNFAVALVVHNVSDTEATLTEAKSEKSETSL